MMCSIIRAFDLNIIMSKIFSSQKKGLTRMTGPFTYYRVV